MKVYLKSGELEKVFTVDDDTTMPLAAILGLQKHVREQIESGADEVKIEIGVMMKLSEVGYEMNDGDVFVWSHEVLRDMTNMCDDSPLKDELKKQTVKLWEMHLKAFAEMISIIGKEEMKRFFGGRRTKEKETENSGQSVEENNQ